MGGISGIPRSSAAVGSFGFYFAPLVSVCGALEGRNVGHFIFMARALWLKETEGGNTSEEGGHNRPKGQASVTCNRVRSPKG